MTTTEPKPANGKALVYTHPECGYCDLLKEDFITKGIAFDEIDVSKRPEYWSEIERLSGGDRITPVTVLADGKVEIGYNGIGCNFNY